MKSIRRLLQRLLWSALAVLVAAIATVWLLLERSLPPLDGAIHVGELAGPVTIERDAQGVPTITATSRTDLAYATGFVHGQDRFFQMDLTRRQAAGELSAIFGELALDLDKRMRWHRFRSRAGQVLETLSEEERETLVAYAAGVNGGLASLRSRPFEYFMLRETPQPWHPEDSLLVAYAMFLDLNDERAIRDVQRGYAARALPRVVFDWLYPAGTRWDAPLTGTTTAAAAVPPAAVFDLRRSSGAGGGVPGDLATDALLTGSNNWAVSGSLSRNGKAIVANDMHLGLSVPNVFYRARLVQTGDDSSGDTGANSRDITGVTLPGTPAVVAGSNGRVAWAFTNSYGDWSDAVIVRPGAMPGTYGTADGDMPFEEHHETIAVKGAADVTVLIRETRWGPVNEDVEWPDGEIAVSWIAHRAGAVNLLHLGLETAATIDSAMDIANRLGIPPQNFVCGDDAGNIGWTIAGKIPQRSAFDASLPADWSELDGWTGWLPAENYPRVRNPPAGRIWTANARVVDGSALQTIGNGGYDLGARAGQIRDKLHSKDLFIARDMLAIQLDDRALFLTPWRDLLLSVLDDEAIGSDAQRKAYRELAEDWVPRATAESAGYRLVRGFRMEVRQMVFDMLMRPVMDSYGKEIELRISNQFEGPLWTLVNEQPAHLLSKDYESWHALLLEAVDRNIRYFEQNFDGGLEQRRWGERNMARIRHPLSRSISALSPWLDMLPQPLDGDSNMPRVMSPDFGPSERFAVSPGDEQNGYLHMPAGQSGHPLSDFYRAGHEAWVQGHATPFLPGTTVHTLILDAANP
ncbi:MAG TPA: penicillin acylase family protein [Woeseiaceae bacterium]|nr:penicillin acylase family protein [Woeseiaceae bacterium]